MSYDMRRSSESKAFRFAANGSIGVQPNQRKLGLFRRRFGGQSDVYGTYDLRTGQARQVKAPVTDKVLFTHLRGSQPYGVYLLVNNMTRALAVDFDDHNLEWPMQFVAAAKNYGIESYIERSKSKGYHVWIFFANPGVLAAKARRVARRILDEIGKPDTEVFPKQDQLDDTRRYGNFINAPLFGTLVPRNRTVFVMRRDPMRPYADQWAFLEQVELVSESALDGIIEVNDLNQVSVTARPRWLSTTTASNPHFGLPPCARRMLEEGVFANQRVACFRLAVQLKRVGLPFDLAVSALMSWAQKNNPDRGKRIITPAEITSQTSYAYRGNYRSCGCEDEAVKPFCDKSCPIHPRVVAP